MDYILKTFSRLWNTESSRKNLVYIGDYHVRPTAPTVNKFSVEAHQRVLLHSFERYLSTAEISAIINDLRRSDVSEEAVLKDFFDGDVDNHVIPWDNHVEHGLTCMLDAFRPPQLCLPCHINDVEHHYPYKWQVNAEPPFSTDEYFLENLPTYGDFYCSETGSFDKYVDPTDLNRRLKDSNLERVLINKVPPKFGFLKSSIFSWTRRWHHIIKDGFRNTAGLLHNAYLRDRFIFPMLLHTKTAIVKKDDPDKMRTIWGCSKPWIIADTMFYWELVAWMKLNHGITPILWSYETMTGGWMRLNHALYRSLVRQSLLTLDWKRFDKRAYYSLIHRIMHGVRTYLDFSKGYVPNQSYPNTALNWDQLKANRLNNLWLWTLENLFHAPIVLPNGQMYRRTFAGIPSGLYITQLLDSWYNYTMLATLLSAMGINPQHCIIKVQGDDSVVRLCLLIPPSEHQSFLLRLSDLALYYFNSVVSTDKSEIRNTLNGTEVLSYRNNAGLPYRDLTTMLAQFYHTKARNPTPSITMAQAAGFAFASCGTDLRVYECLRNVWDFYAKQGYTPNRAGLSLVFGNSPDVVLPHYDLDHFPTMNETTKYLGCMDYHNDQVESRTWPLDYFVYPPCKRPT